MLYDWPKASILRRAIPKNKIYEHAGANTALKELFVHEVEQVLWAHKLAPETINMTASKSASEIQVFRVTQKTSLLSSEVLRAIDKVIPFLIIFELVYNDRIKLIAAYKRPNQSDSSRWVVGDYYASEWIADDNVRVPLPVALNLGVLYEQVLTSLVSQQVERLTASIKAQLTPSDKPEASISPVSLAEIIAHAEAIKMQMREVDKAQSRLEHERQFNKRVTINAELRAAKQKLEQLAVANLSTATVDNSEVNDG